MLDASLHLVKRLLTETRWPILSIPIGCFNLLTNPFRGQHVGGEYCQCFVLRVESEFSARAQCELGFIDFVRGRIVPVYLGYCFWHDLPFHGMNCLSNASCNLEERYDLQDRTRCAGEGDRLEVLSFCDTAV